MNLVKTIYTPPPEKLCPKCGEPMENKGNLSGLIYTSNPPQRDNTWVCYKCKCKTIERERGQIYETETFSDYTTF